MVKKFFSLDGGGTSDVGKVAGSYTEEMRTEGDTVEEQRLRGGWRFKTKATQWQLAMEKEE